MGSPGSLSGNGKHLSEGSPERQSHTDVINQYDKQYLRHVQNQPIKSIDATTMSQDISKVSAAIPLRVNALNTIAPDGIDDAVTALVMCSTTQGNSIIRLYKLLLLLLLQVI